jgi:hypothetical protein
MSGAASGRWVGSTSIGKSARRQRIIPPCGGDFQGIWAHRPDLVLLHGNLIVAPSSPVECFYVRIAGQTGTIQKLSERVSSDQAVGDWAGVPVEGRTAMWGKIPVSRGLWLPARLSLSRRMVTAWPPLVPAPWVGANPICSMRERGLNYD